MRANNYPKTLGALCLSVGLALCATACDKGQAASDPQVTKAAELAKKIEAKPEAAAQTLEAASMSVEEFETLMMDIAADPDKSAAFEAAKAG